MKHETGDLNNFSKFTDKHKKQTSGGVLLKDNLNNFTKFTEKHLCQSLFFNKVAGWKSKNVRSSHSRCFVKKVFWRRLVFHKRLFIDPLQNRCSWIIHKFTGKNLCWSLFLIKLQFWEPATLLLKKTPAQVFPCEICKLFKNNYFGEYPWTSAS